MPLVSYMMLSSSQDSSSSRGGESFCVAGGDGCGVSDGCVGVLQGGALVMERVDTARVGMGLRDSASAFVFVLPAFDIRGYRAPGSCNNGRSGLPAENDDWGPLCRAGAHSAVIAVVTRCMFVAMRRRVRIGFAGSNVTRL